MHYLLDTNIVICTIKRRPPEVSARFAQCRASELLLSSISLAELLLGAARSRQPDKALAGVAAIADVLAIAPFDDVAARAYGPLRADLERQGTPIGALDTLIAAHALALDATLITHNLDEFRRVPGLRLEDWTL